MLFARSCFPVQCLEVGPRDVDSIKSNEVDRTLMRMNPSIGVSLFSFTPIIAGC